MFKPSGNPRVKELTETWTERSYSLYHLKVIKLPELNSKGKPKRLCAWCAEKEVFGNQKYCNMLCMNSATAWAYPQKEDGLRFLLIRQEWKCFHCGFDYLPIFKEILLNDRHYRSNDFDPDIIAWYYFKHLKRRLPRDRRPEVDHILALRHGGVSLGLENHQILCTTCHRLKTAKDNSKRVYEVE